MSEQKIEVAVITWGVKARDVLAMRDGSRWRTIEGHSVCSDPTESGVVVRRRLAVIDPHDSPAVERLQDLYIVAEAKGLSGLSMQAALTEYANPTPPKPDEPQQLGAAVVGRNGDTWQRTFECGVTDRNPWCSGNMHRAWEDIDVVDVIREGL